MKGLNMKTAFEITFETIGGFVGEMINGNKGKKRGKEIGAIVGKVVEEAIKVIDDKKTIPQKK